MSTPSETIRVLHVDDEPSFAEMVATFLEREDDRFTVETAMEVSEGLDRLGETDFDCIVSDYDMPGRNGIEFLEAVREGYPDLPFVLFTGKGSEEVASEAISAGVSDYLQKRSGTEQYELLANRIANAVTEYTARRFERVAKHDPMTLLNRIFDGFLTLDDDWRFTYVNQEAQNIFGRSAGESRGERIWEVFPEARDTPLYDRYHEVMEAMEPRTIEEYFEPWDRWFREHLYPSEDGLSVLFRDVTEEKRGERELRMKERRYQAIFNDPNILVGLIDTDGTVLDINQTAMAYIDATIEDVTGEPFWETPWFDHSEAVREDVKEWIDRAAGGEYVRFEVDLVRPDGSPYVIEGVFRPVTDEDGEVVSLLISDRDVTEAKEREQEYERLLDLLNHTEQIADVGGWEIDPETRAVFWSDHLFEMRGLDPGEEPPLEEVLGAYVEADRPAVERAVEDALETGAPFDVEARLRRSDGELLWFRIRGQPTMEDGRVVTLRGAVQDITDHKERERELMSARAEYEELFNGMNDAAWVIGLDEVFLAVNDAAVERSGYSRAELLSMRPRDIDAGLDGGEISALLREMPEDEMQVFETIRETKGGDRIPVEISSSLITYRGEKAVLSIGRDISDRKQREEQLAEFASVVSHDLRNPLNVAEGYLELARQEYDSHRIERDSDLDYDSDLEHDDDLEHDIDHLDRVARAHDRMRVLIEDLLRLAREGEPVSETEPVSLKALTERCWENVATAEATLDVDIAGDRTIRGDGSRLQQLLENLIRNAVEHGGEDVSVTVGVMADGFYVEDDGPGVDEADREAVFDAGYTTSKDGAGFGLSIAEQVAAAHGWNLRATDGSGGGARFEITGVEFVAA